MAVFLAFPAFSAPLSIGPHRFTVEEATTTDERERGLMYRKNLPPGHGMLFINAQVETTRMWMKDTFIPLDMLFLDERGRIVYIAANTTPLSLDVITPGVPVKAVLELPAGTCQKQGIKPGDMVSHAVFHSHP